MRFNQSRKSHKDSARRIGRRKYQRKMLKRRGYGFSKEIFADKLPPAGDLPDNHPEQRRRRGKGLEYDESPHSSKPPRGLPSG